MQVRIISDNNYCIFNAEQIWFNKKDMKLKTTDDKGRRETCGFNEELQTIHVDNHCIYRRGD